MYQHLAYRHVWIITSQEHKVFRHQLIQHLLSTTTARYAAALTNCSSSTSR